MIAVNSAGRRQKRDISSPAFVAIFTPVHIFKDEVLLSKVP